MEQLITDQNNTDQNNGLNTFIFEQTIRRVNIYINHKVIITERNGILSYNKLYKSCDIIFKNKEASKEQLAENLSLFMSQHKECIKFNIKYGVSTLNTVFYDNTRKYIKPSDIIDGRYNIKFAYITSIFEDKSNKELTIYFEIQEAIITPIERTPLYL
jgi:dsDNA-binding SOS-regulon protein